MKIPQQLPHFNRRTVLFIVTGKQEAVFYKASDGLIERVHAFKISEPEQSDRESEFKTRGRGQTFRSGSAWERRNNDVIRDFISKFRHDMSEYVHPEYFHRAYLFVPPQVKAKVWESIPQALGKRISVTIDGNYINKSPLELVKMVARFEVGSDRRVIPTKPEAQKILNRSNQARTIMGM